MTILFANNATSRLQIDTPAASGTITVPSGQGAQFPSPGAGDSFMVTLEDRRTGQMEICRCTSRVADVLTVTRALEGTIAQDFVAGATVSNRMTAGTLEVLQEAYLKPEADALFVNVSGDTMTGPLSLPAGAPTAGPHATNKTYVDTGLATKAPTVHVHPMTDVTGLVAALAGKEAVAPIDGAFYGRMATSWTIPGIPQITGLQAALDTKLGDAPSDSVIYGRRNAIWTAVLFDWTSITGKPPTYPPTLPIQEVDVINLVADLAARITDAPTDGAQYARAAGAWTVVSGGAGGGIPEAPTDGQLYGRKSSNWFVVPATVTWSTLTGKPSTFPPTTPIAQSDITNLVADQAAQNTSINSKEPAITIGTTAQYWRGDKTWQALSSITVDAYTKAESDAKYELKITVGSTAQYWRGDKSWQTLDKTAVGLSNVDNVSDANKPVSTAQAAAIALKVAKAGDTMTGDLTINKAIPAFLLNKTTAGDAGVYGQYNGLNRWVVDIADGIAETGGNLGSNFGIYRYNDAGTLIGTPISIARNTGVVNFAVAPTVAGAAMTSGSKMTCSATAPSSPADNDLWWHTDLAALFVRYNDGTSTAWVQIG